MPQTIIIPDGHLYSVNLDLTVGGQENRGYAGGFYGSYVTMNASAGYLMEKDGDDFVIKIRLTAFMIKSEIDGRPRGDFTEKNKDVTLLVQRFPKIIFNPKDNQHVLRSDTLGKIKLATEPWQTANNQYSPEGRRDVCTVNQVVKQWNLYTWEGKMEVRLWPLQVTTR